MDILRLPNELLDVLWTLLCAEYRGDRDLVNLSKTSHAFHNILRDRILLEGSKIGFYSSPLFWAIKHDRMDIVQRAVELEPYGYEVNLQHLNAMIEAKRRDMAMLLLKMEGIRQTLRDLDPESNLMLPDTLFLACQSGMVEIVEALFAIDGFRYDTREFIGGYQPLHVASQYGHVEVCRLLLAKGFNPETAWRFMPECHLPNHGTHENHIECLKLFLEHGMDTCRKAIEAVAKSNPDALKLLLEYGAHPDHPRPGDGDATALIICNHHPDETMVHLLLEYGADVHSCSPRTGKSALHGASESVARLLVERGVDVNALDDNDQSPIFTTVDVSHIRFLVENGARLDLIDNNGNTLLHHVFKPYDDRWDKKEPSAVLAALEYFLDNGLDTIINKPNNDGSTPLHLALHRWTDKDDIWPGAQLLLDRGADINARDARGMTPLMSFCDDSTEKSNGLDDHFFDYNPDLNASTPDGRTTLILALKAQGPENVHISQKLLEQSAHVNAYGSNEKIRALHFAAYRGNIVHVENLINHGADVNARDARGHTPLMVANWARHPTGDERTRGDGRTKGEVVVRRLLDHGADEDARDELGRTAEDYRGEWLAGREGMPEFFDLVGGWGVQGRGF